MWQARVGRQVGRLAGCFVCGMWGGLVVGRMGEPAVVAGPAGGSALTIHVVAALAMSSLRFPLAVDTTAGRGGKTDGEAGRAGSARSAQQPARQPARQQHWALAAIFTHLSRTINRYESPIIGLLWISCFNANGRRYRYSSFGLTQPSCSRHQMTS